MQGTEVQQTSYRARVRGTRLIAQAGAWLYHFDETGRLLLAAGPQQVVRRGFDNRLLQVTTPSYAAKRGATAAGDAVGRGDSTGCGDAASPGTAGPRAATGIDPTVGALVYRTYHELGADESAEFYRAAYGATRQALQRMRSAADGTHSDRMGWPHSDQLDWVAWERRLEPWTPEALAEDAGAFRAVYSPISILPPDQYHALVVQVTLGCSYNKCLFCDFYRDRRFHIRSERELEAHLDHLMAFLGPRVADRKTVFLADGNAFVVPTERLIQMITQIRRRLSADDIEFNAFMDTFTLEYKKPADLRRIYEAGLHTVYSGLETGSNRLREFLAKPGTAEAAVDALNTLKAGGFRLGVIVLVGVGGPAAADEHLADTLEALRRIRFTEGDVIYLSPFVDPDTITGYRETLATAGFDAFTQDGLAQELVRWRRALAAMQIPDGHATRYVSGGAAGPGGGDAAEPTVDVAGGTVKPLAAKVTLYSILEHIYG